MSLSCRILLLIPACIVLVACGSTHSTGGLFAGKAPAVEATWFCVANGAWDGWNCAQDPTLWQEAAAPLPVQHVTLTDVPVEPVAASEPPVPVADLNVSESQTVPTVAPVTAPRQQTATGHATHAATGPDWQSPAYHPGAELALEELPSGYYAVQVVALSSLEGLEEFRHVHHLEDLPAVRIESGGRIFHVLLLGVYETRTEAQMAADSRPGSLQHHKPWIRSLGSLQDAHRRAEGSLQASGTG